MKKTLITLIAVLLVCSLTGCMRGGNADKGHDGIIGNEEEVDGDPIHREEDDVKDDMRDIRDDIDDKIDDIVPDNGDGMLPDADDLPNVENGIVSDNSGENGTDRRGRVGQSDNGSMTDNHRGQNGSNGQNSTNGNGGSGTFDNGMARNRGDAPNDNGNMANFGGGLNGSGVTNNGGAMGGRTVSGSTVDGSSVDGNTISGSNAIPREAIR